MSKHRIQPRGALLTVLVCGAALRFVPIWFGLPFDEARPDEETAIGHALAMLAGDPNPHFFHWPSLTFYLFAAAFRLASLIKQVLGAGAVLTANEHYLIARGLVAAAGTITIAVVFALTREFADETTALIAAILVAVAPLHVRESHFAMTDALMTLLVTASVALLLRGIRTDQPDDRRGPVWWFATAGLTGGLAASTKYSAAAVLASAVVGACVLGVRAAPGTRARTMLTSATTFAAMFVFGFVAGTPYALLDFRSFASGFGFDVAHLSTGQAFLDLGPGWTYHVTRSLPYGLGLSTFAAATAGLFVTAWAYPEAALVIGAFCAVLYGSLGPGRTVFFRYVLPIVPFACVAAAVVIERIAAQIRSRRSMHIATTVALATIVALPPLANSVRFDWLLARTDTRVLAAQWLTSRTKPDESLYDAGGVYAGGNYVGVMVHVWSVDTFDPASNTFKGSGGALPDWLVLPESPLVYGSVPAGLRGIAAAHYVEVHTIDARRPGPNDSVYDPQDAFFLPIAGFDAVLRPGPTLRIYRRVSAR